MKQTFKTFHFHFFINILYLLKNLPIFFHNLKEITEFNFFEALFVIHREKKLHRLHLERIVEHFLNLFTTNIDFQDIRIR